MPPSLRAESDRGMVVAPHHLAAEAGAQMLREGGSAADAIIATNAALAVAYPHMCGVGGDLFVLGWSQSDGLFGLNGSGRAAAEATPGWYRDRGFEAIPARGSAAVLTVPGCVDGWWQLHRRFGRLPWARLFERAIVLAEQGVAVAPGLARGIEEDRETLAASPQLSKTFLGAGREAAGTVVRQAELARTLRKISMGGPDVFYRGEIARALAAAFHADGSPIRASDLAAHQSDWFDPLTLPYRDLTVAALPPNTQGLAFLETMAILEGFPMKELGQGTPASLHHEIEAAKLGLADRNRWIGDASRCEGLAERLLAADYIAAQRARIQPSRAGAAAGSGRGDTCYFTAVDADGLALSTIESLFWNFGSAYVAGHTGITLQNRGSSFRFAEGHPNLLEGGLRPMHTLCPGMLLKDGRPHLVFGNMGGGAQPQFMVQVAMNVVEYGMDPATAVAAPRWVYGWQAVEGDDSIAVEDGVSAETIAALRAMGHKVLDPVGPYRDDMGHASAIRVHPDGRLEGGADPRADGAAVGV